MRPSTFFIALGPAFLMLALKFAVEPTWLENVSLFTCLGIGSAMGVVGGVAASVVEL